MRRNGGLLRRLMPGTDEARKAARERDFLDLLEAASAGEGERVKRLLEADAGLLNRRNYYGWTPLMYAALNGREEVVKGLLAREGVDANAVNVLGGSALSCCGDGAVCRLLLAFPRTDLDIKVGEDDLLEHASRKGRNAVVEALLERPHFARKLLHDVDMPRCLGLAARGGHLGVCRLLIRHGARPTGWREQAVFPSLPPGVAETLDKWRSFLPEWGATSWRLYPRDFEEIRRIWFLVCLRIRPKLGKDMRYLVVKYIARNYRSKRDQRAV